MDKPSNLLLKLSRRLFDDTTEQEKFIDALIHPEPFYPCILWCREKRSLFKIEPPLSWQPYFVDRLSFGEKPGQHPLHNEGYYYCLDFSSVFAAMSLSAVRSPIHTIFDMCAAPGGKSIFAWKALQPQLLVCNEAIGKRVGMLISNLKRCRISPTIVLSKDSSELNQISSSSQLVIVDAPCSGQSLLAKGGKVPGCFHPTTINKNANRQKRIITNSAQLVAPKGYLTYMTCTYSIEENEQVCEWFLNKFPQFQAVEVPELVEYQSHHSSIPCYRLFPQSKLGAGAFTVLFQNTEMGEIENLDVEVLQRVGIRYQLGDMNLITTKDTKEEVLESLLVRDDF
ncbi:RsmB/NOP family class I SAM-dependent RNA methyltransferase [Gloeocapsopsis dulcis]|uniref:Fmu (Sun) domain-containing protein n=2 Tax=Gloeocapsopsis TaxID=693222 RepID=A0A6N8FQH3_9CHRO|nr:RsmB/NOP family class I SAM-dependent RNA methyltransferase [Gloeocapsopsis dulcis]MUL35478.1 Fmu (Sun) domain-containing protein [Gloeocapsopsis dulcis AAB1 = 1H9]